MGRGEATFAGDGGGTKSLRRWAWAAAGALTAVALAIFAGSRNALEMPASVTNSCDCPPVCFPVGGIEELHRLGGGLLLRLRDSEFAERAGAASDTTGAREDSLLSYGLESDFVGKPTGYWNCVTHLTLYWFPMQLGISLTFFLSIHCLKNTVVYFDPSEEWCDEKKVMYKLISGLHSSISVHIASEYLLDSSANLMLYDRVWKHPDQVRNLYFIFLFVLWAVTKAADYLEQAEYNTGNHVEDLKTVIDSEPIQKHQCTHELCGM
ncbi:PPR repeat [Musa troglodytarum]|uniref:PPR repeat n=1 Tax=Musa troglodytarum TaxID=320322 RepID=A0A9E7JEZ8_9LILI|nr:PPR repeat [Musa troglodytarum]